MILRASSTEELVGIPGTRAGPPQEGPGSRLVGSRSEVRIDRLSELVPDLRNRDVYVSGPEGFVDRSSRNRLAARGPEGVRPLRGLFPMRAQDRSARSHAPTTKELHRMRRAPAVVVASAAGLAGIGAMHVGSAPPVLGGAVLGPGHSSPTATNPPSTTGAATTAVGTSEQYGYGTLAVKVTVRGSRITDVLHVARTQTAEQY